MDDKLTKFNQIINIKASINWGLSNKLKSSLKFLNIIPVKRPVINTFIIPNPYWISGLVSGNDCFYIKITKQALKDRIQLSFKISLHNKDKNLM
jgi:hypothetical protein